MARTVTVTTGARLHFGPLSYRPAEGRHFGGVGLMIARPGFQITFTKADRSRVTGDPLLSERILAFIDRIREHMPADRFLPSCVIDVVRSVPLHSGLGSGTQLGLAVARGLTELAAEDGVSAETLASRVERGRRSAVGVHGFASGGLIVDAGKRGDEKIGALACRLPFPDSWRVMLLTPEHGRPGLSGTPEERAFERLGSMPATLSDRLCRIVVTELLPAVHTADFDAFSEAVFDYGSRVGEFFAPVQGGTFGNSRTDELVRRLIQLGIRGVGQTSWGPTVFAFVSSVKHGEDLAQRLQADRTGPSKDCGIQLVGPLNAGAEVSVEDAD